MNSPTVSIVDYGVGNIGSIANMLRKCGAQTVIISRPEDVAEASRLVLPGVGKFDQGMENLTRLGLVPALNEAVLDRGIPILGICLGMQLMCKSSEEGQASGLGWVDAKVRRFPKDAGFNIKIPHMGWNTAASAPDEAMRLPGISATERFYFVHSYYVECTNPLDALMTTTYGIQFCSAFRVRNIIGTQFHPEKSHSFGMRLFKAILE